MTCSTCKFWKPTGINLDHRGQVPHTPTEDDKSGECRSRPPVHYASPHGGGFRAFPVTRAVDGCGSWQAIPSSVSETKDSGAIPFHERVEILKEDPAPAKSKAKHKKS